MDHTSRHDARDYTSFWWPDLSPKNVLAMLERSEGRTANKSRVNVGVNRKKRRRIPPSATKKMKEKRNLRWAIKSRKLEEEKKRGVFQQPLVY